MKETFSSIDMKNEIKLVPMWFLKSLENTLRIQYNIEIEKGKPETCQLRNIRGALNGVRKLINDEGLTGMERLAEL